MPITRSLMIDRRGFLVGIVTSAAAGALPARAAEPLNYVRVRGPLFRQAMAHAVDLGWFRECVLHSEWHFDHESFEGRTLIRHRLGHHADRERVCGGGRAAYPAAATSKAPPSMLSRRTLLASHHRVARDAAGRAITPREAFFLAEHRWAVEGVLAAVKARNLSAWRWNGDEQERPFRSRLARLFMTLRTLDEPSKLELKILDETDYLWRELTRPRDLRSG